MNNDPYYNPVGTEHPLRGRIVGAAILAIAAAVIVCLCVSCTAMSQDGAASRTFVTNAINVVGGWAARVLESGRVEPDMSVPDVSGERETANGTERLVYRFGGFDGSCAVETPEAQIADLQVTDSEMRYRWLRGGCEALGAADEDDYDFTMACAFFWSEKERAWIGGKFDWISTSRTSRDFRNIFSGYGGWPAEEFFWAPRRAFCIVSRDGLRRTNLITED